MKIIFDDGTEMTMNKNEQGALGAMLTLYPSLSNDLRNDTESVIMVMMGIEKFFKNEAMILTEKLALKLVSDMEKETEKEVSDFKKKMERFNV